MLWIRPVGYPANFYFRIRYLTGYDSGISCQISESLDIRLKKQQVFLKQRIVTSFDWNTVILLLLAILQEN